MAEITLPRTDGSSERYRLAPPSLIPAPLRPMASVPSTPPPMSSPTR